MASLWMCCCIQQATSSSDLISFVSINHNYNTHTHTQAIEIGNHEGARIYAQDAIREKNQSLNHLRMASRLDACCSRIETAVRMNQVSAGMKGVVKGMDKSLAAMNIDQLSKVMDKFESQFEDLDVKVGNTKHYCFIVNTEGGIAATLVTAAIDQIIFGCCFELIDMNTQATYSHDDFPNFRFSISFQCVRCSFY